MTFPQTAKEHYDRAMELLSLPEYQQSPVTVARAAAHLEASKLAPELQPSSDNEQDVYRVAAAVSETTVDCMPHEPCWQCRGIAEAVLNKLFPR